MGTVVQRLLRHRLASISWLGLAAVIAVGIFAVICALLGQYSYLSTVPATPLVGNVQVWLAQHFGSSDGQSIPLWVVIISLLAIVSAALSFPYPFFNTALPHTPPHPFPSSSPPSSDNADTSLTQESALRLFIHKMRHSVYGRFVTALGLMGIPCLIAALIWAQESFTPHQDVIFVHTASSWAALLWALGMLASIVYLWPWDASRITQWLVVCRSRWLWLVLEAVCLMLIVDAAAILRLWNLGTIPEGVWFDEVDFAHAAQRLSDLPFQPFGPYNVGHNPSLYFYSMAVVFHFAGVSISTIRFSSVLFGMLLVVAIYLLGRRIGGKSLGLCAASFVGMSQWAVDFSRFGMSNIAAPAMISVGLLAFTLAMQRPRSFWFALSGLVLGLSILTYAGGFLAALGVVVVITLVRFIQDTTFRSAAWPNVFLLPVGFCVGAAPFLISLLKNAEYTLFREHQVSLFNQQDLFGAGQPTGIGACIRQFPAYLHEHVAALGTLGNTACLDAVQNNIQKHLLMFTIIGDGNGRHNLPGAPMLDVITGACFLLGIGICLRHIRHWFSLMLLLWLSITMLGGVLSLHFEAPQGARTIGAIAPIALISALPLAAFATQLQRLSMSWLSRHRHNSQDFSVSARLLRDLISVLVTSILLLVPLGTALAANRQNYFDIHQRDITSWLAMDGTQTILGRAAADLAKQGFTVRVSPALLGDPMLTFAAGEKSLPAFDPSVPVPLPVNPGGLALLMSVDDTDTFLYIRHMYPQAQVISLSPQFDSTNVRGYAVLIRPADAAGNVGATVTFKNGLQENTIQHVTGSVSWPSQSTAETYAELRSTLMISENDAWQPVAFRVQGAIHASISIDGTLWSNRATDTIRLGAGNHRLVVQAQGKSADTLAVQWRQGADTASFGDQGWHTVPDLSLASPTLPTGGLLGLYYTHGTIDGSVALARVDQLVNTYYQNPPVGRAFPFAIRWLGRLRLTQNGSYAFKIDSSGPAQLFIDGRQVLNTSLTNPSIVTLFLNEGSHRIQLDYTAAGGYLHCYFTWQPPGQSGFTPLPPTVTEPDHG